MSETFSLWHADAGVGYVSSVVTDLTPPGHLMAISAGKRAVTGRFQAAEERRAR
jgi:hypothetical protein